LAGLIKKIQLQKISEFDLSIHPTELAGLIKKIQQQNIAEF
jgi:hypothetical protein